MNLLSEFVGILKNLPSNNIYIASDSKKLLYLLLKDKDSKFIDITHFLEEVVATLGDDYTILLPTFNWGFCNGIDYDYSNTPSDTGILSQAALKSNYFKRTLHPIYSFAVHGKLQNEFRSLNNIKSFGEGSPFELLFKYDFCFFALDVSFNNSFTYVHHVEQNLSVNYRYEKEFISNYIDEKGNKSKKKYSMFVRDIDKNVVTNLSSFLSEVEEKKIIHHDRLFDIPFFYFSIALIDYELQTEIENNQGKGLYVTKR